MDFLQARLGPKASVAAGEAMLVRDRQQDGQGDGQSENRVSPLQGINVLQRMMRDVGMISTMDDLAGEELRIVSLS